MFNIGRYDRARGALEPTYIQMTSSKNNSATEKNSTDGETNKRVLFNGMPKNDEHDLTWIVLPENDIVPFRLDKMLPWEDPEKDHPFYSPCDLKTVVVRVSEGKMLEFYQHFDNHFHAADYCEFLLNLVTNGPVSKNVQTWQLGKQTLVIIENEMVILMEVIGKSAAAQVAKTQNQPEEQ